MYIKNDYDLHRVTPKKLIIYRAMSCVVRFSGTPCSERSLCLWNLLLCQDRLRLTVTIECI